MVTVYGARTLADPGIEAEWKYINVRRLFLYLRESIDEGTAWAVFEPNDASTWVKVKSMIENYLIQKWRDGALAGTKPDQAFFVNIGLGEALTNSKAVDAAVADMTTITGQKPVVTKARRSIAQFKIREGNTIGVKVTLRGQRMWDFLERLTRLALPRIRDFRGVPSKSFDGRGNYSLGLREQLAFPEIDYDKVDRLRGLEMTVVTTAKTDEEGQRLLALLGMPFEN